MITNFKEFLNSIIMEQLHPELHDIVTSSQKGTKSKQSEIASKIRAITARGESTGIEGNMPKGSSRAYLKHADNHPITIDGREATIQHGVKIAIKSNLDKYHNKNNHIDESHPHGMTLGQLQNDAENGDHFINTHYRILTQNPQKPNEYKSNKDMGIFPPHIDHDDSDNWSHIGHASDVSQRQFKELTKTDTHPKGISHADFFNALDRNHNKNNGRYWEGSPEEEKDLDHISNHPLVEKFQDYHSMSGNPHGDLRQIKNMGVFHHPDGSKHIVARDHGYSTEVANAYANAWKNQYKRWV